eukprot:8554839-Ditylum_brightwellii.AAC.1
MLEQADGPTPAAVPSAPAAAGNGPRQRRNKNENNSFIKQEPVKGETTKLVEHIYDTGPNAQSQFASTTRAIGEYMMRTSKNA